MNKKYSLVLAFLTFTAINSVFAIEEKTFSYFCDSDYKQLKYGNRSLAISDLQKILNLENNANNGTGGLFGPSTRRSIRQLQFKNNLLQTGTMGPRTFNLLNNKYCGTSFIPKSDNILNSNIPLTEIIEVKDGFTLYEREIIESPFSVVVKKSTNTKNILQSDVPTINVFETQISFGIGESNLFANWESVGFDKCNLYEVRQAEIINNKFVPTERSQIGVNLPTNSLSKSYRFYQSAVVKNSTSTATVIQLECVNELRKIIERKSAFIFHTPGVFSF